MAQLQPYKTTSDLNKGSMVRIDDNLFIAIMALGQKQNNTELLTYTPIVGGSLRVHQKLWGRLFLILLT